VIQLFISFKTRDSVHLCIRFVILYELPEDIRYMVD